jgi:hypothetical protein
VAMAKFASEALAKMQRLAKKLEVELGPDTGDLSYVERPERCLVAAAPWHGHSQ